MLAPSRETSLRAYLLFDHAEASSLARIEASLSRRTLRGGENIWWMGDPAVHVTIIERGLVQVARPVLQGASSVIALFGPGDTIGLTAAVEDVRYPADAVVISSSAQIVRVAADVVRNAISTDAAFAGSIQRALLAHTRILLSKIEIASAGSVAQRLATLLLQLGVRFGENTDERRTAVPIALSRATLAGLVDARVETVIRALSSWRGSNIWRTTEDGFEIDRAALGVIARQS